MSEDPRKAWAHPKYHKIWRLIGKALILLSVCVGLIDTYLWFRFLDTRPAHPDPSQGRVYVMNNHGIYRYLTKKEDNLLTVMPVISISLFVGAGLIYYFVLGKRPRKPQPWEKKQF